MSQACMRAACHDVAVSSRMQDGHAHCMDLQNKWGVAAARTLVSAHVGQLHGQRGEGRRVRRTRRGRVGWDGSVGLGAGRTGRGGECERRQRELGGRYGAGDPWSSPM